MTIPAIAPGLADIGSIPSPPSVPTRRLAVGIALLFALVVGAIAVTPDTDEQLTRTAAADWVKLSRAYDERFGEAPCITDSYRSLAAQSSLYAVKPGLAARPGTSNHGWGVALDLCGGAESYSTEEYAWLAENGHRWGWSNPDWARLSGSRPEPWHWEHAAS